MTFDGVEVNALLGRAVWVPFTPVMLNPEWDEQLMGWPTGWTGLPPEVIGRIKKARRRLRGKHLARAARTTLDASKE